MGQRPEHEAVLKRKSSKRWSRAKSLPEEEVVLKRKSP